MTRSRTGLVLGVLAIAAVVLALWPRHANQPDPARLPMPASMGPAVAQRGSPNAPTAGDRSPAAKGGRPSLNPSSLVNRGAPLPPPGQPLTQIYDQLKQQVAHGDARAACRLGFEINRCAQLPVLRSVPRMFQQASQRYAPGTPQYENARRVQQQAERNLQSAEGACAGFTVDDPSISWDYTLAAALAGNREAIFSALSFPPGLNASRPENTLEGWTQWRQYAPQLMEAGIALGDPRVFRIAARNYLAPSFGTRIVDADPARSLALLSALLPVTAPSYRPVIERDISAIGASQEQQEDARRIASSLPRLTNIPEGGVDWARGMAPDSNGKQCEEP